MAQEKLRHGKLSNVTAERQNNGRWRARARVGYLDGHGNLRAIQLSRTADTRTEAVRLIPTAAKELIAKRVAARRSNRTPRTMTELLRKWRDELENAGVHGQTKVAYSYTVAALLGEDRTGPNSKKRISRANEPRAKAFVAIAGMKPADVTQGHVKRLLLEVANGSGPSVAERVRTVLRNAFHLAKDYGIAGDNPAMGLRYRPSDGDDYRKKPKRRVDNLDHNRAPTDKEVADLLAALQNDPIAERPTLGASKRSKNGEKYVNPQDVADYVYLLFSAGTRGGEAAALRWSDINLSDEDVTHRIKRINPDSHQLEEVTITIPPGHASINGTIVQIIGQGLTRGVTKSTAGCRVIPLASSAVDMLRARAIAMGVPYLSRTNQPIFGALTEPMKFRQRAPMGRAIAHLFDKYGVDWSRTHGARKYVTTRLHRLGFDNNRIMRYMGWSDPKTLLSYLDKKQDLPTAMGDSLDLTAVGVRAPYLRVV